MWLIAGWVALFIGFVGIFVPLLPTVPFLILAAFCFEKGSPKLHHWIIHHPKFGPPIVSWQQHRVISWKAKTMAVSCMTGSFLYVFFFKSLSTPILVVIGLTMTLVSSYILTRKSKKDGDYVKP